MRMKVAMLSIGFAVSTSLADDMADVIEAAEVQGGARGLGAARHLHQAGLEATETAKPSNHKHHESFSQSGQLCNTT